MLCADCCSELLTCGCSLPSTSRNSLKAEVGLGFLATYSGHLLSGSEPSEH
jgi:hypothetical protein